VSDDDFLTGARQGLAVLEGVLMRMTRRRAEYGPNFRFTAEQVVEELLRMRQQLDDRIGLTAYLAEFGPPAPVTPAPSA
jgi:hypothetical protein